MEAYGHWPPLPHATCSYANELLIFSTHTPGKLENLEAALQSFNRSLDLAKALDDEQSQKAIGKAIEDINARLAQPDDATEGKDGEESS